MWSRITKLAEKISSSSSMRRATADNSLKGVTTLRNGRSYAINLPRFTALPGANSINIDRDQLHNHFRKLTPKQRIAVLTIRDRNIIPKLYSISNVRLFLSNPSFIFYIGTLVQANERDETDRRDSK
jgi:hypothetical protein